MINYFKDITSDKNKLLKFIKDFGDEDIYLWCRESLDLIYKKILLLDDICLCGKLLSSLHNLYYYFNRFKGNEDCVYYLAISIYFIGLEAGILRFNNRIESFKFFNEFIGEDDWSEVKSDISHLVEFDLNQSIDIYNNWKDKNELLFSIMGLQSSNVVSVYLGYKF